VSLLSRLGEVYGYIYSGMLLRKELSVKFYSRNNRTETFLIAMVLAFILVLFTVYKVLP